MSKDPVDYLHGMANSTVAAFLMASVAYFFNLLKWLFCLSGPSYCVNPPLDVITGVIYWMGGPVDIGFYAFIASEGGRYMILAAIEKRRMRREWEKEREEWRTKLEAAEKRAEKLAEALEKARKDDRAA